MKMAVIGYGAVGDALAHRLADKVGPVVVGVRNPDERTADIGGIRFAGVTEACRGAEVIFLAVPSESAAESIEGAELEGKVIVDCTNPLKFDGRPVWDPPEEGSNTAMLSKRRPEAKWTKGFATFGAAFHADPDVAGRPVDLHLAGDDEAKRVVAEIGSRAGFHPIDCGPVENASLLESLAILWIHLAHVGGLGRDFAFQVVRRS